MAPVDRARLKRQPFPDGQRCDVVVGDQAGTDPHRYAHPDELFLPWMLPMNRAPSTEPEHHLLERVAGGDRDAFRELYDATARRIYFYLYRLLQDDALAEDVQMEVYVEVWKGAGNFRGQSKVTTWMFGIARNLAFKTLRKQRNHANIDDYGSLEDPDQPDLDAPDRQRVVKQAMTMISVKHREVLDLVFFQQMRYQEIASLLDVSVNTVKTRVYYAKAALLKTMDELGVTKDDL